MDELNLLRDWDAGTEPLSESARLAARERLLAQTRAATPAADRAPAGVPWRFRPRRPAGPDRRPGAPGMTRRTAVRTLVAAGATAAAVGTPLALLNRDDAPRPGVTGRAVLRRAARLERRRERTRLPVEPGRGEYVYARVVVLSTADDTGRSRTLTREDWMAADPSRPSWLTRGGTGRWEQDEDNAESWPPTDWRTLTRVPTEPAALLRYSLSPFRGTEFARMPPGEFGRNEWQTAFDRLLALLASCPVLTDGLLPAAFEALAEFPDLLVTGRAVDASGRDALAVTYEHALLPGPPVDSPPHLLFASDTYAYLGVRRQVETLRGTTVTELSFLDDYAVVDEVRRRP